MSASARAEARRKAILARGTDRLAKLTTSARGEDAPAYLHDDPPLASVPNTSRNFLGEDSTDMSSPIRLSPSPGPSPNANKKSPSPSPSRNIFENAGLGAGAGPDPSVWSPEQQQRFMAALMGASPMQPESLPQSPLGDPFAPINPNMAPLDNPLAAMLFPQQNGSSFPFGPGAAGKAPGTSTGVQPPTRLQKLMPLLHMLAMWLLLAYFVLWKEPQVHDVSGLGGVAGKGLWKRWAELGWKNPLSDGVLGVQVVPFFWAFTTLQIALHSVRIISGFDAVQPPTLLAFALPHLPPPIPSVIVNSLKYMQMGSLFLDDLAGLLVGIAFIMYFSQWFAT